MFDPDKKYASFNKSASKDAEAIIKFERKKRLQEIDFIDDGKKGYSEAEVKRDLETVERMKEKFEKGQDHMTDAEIKRAKENENRGEALEVIILDKGEELEWFGLGTRLSRTTKHDDIFNGVDGVAEFVSKEKTTHRVALAVDASMNSDFSALKRKIDRNIRKITNNKDEIEVKYFKSAIDDFKGKLALIIPVVIGMEGKKANELIGIFSQIMVLQAREPKSGEELKKLDQLLIEAKNHPCQVIFLKEIKEQIAFYKELLAGDKSIKAQLFMNEINSLLEIINLIIGSKKEILGGELEKDGVYLTIKNIISQERKNKNRN